MGMQGSLRNGEPGKREFWRGSPPGQPYGQPLKWPSVRRIRAKWLSLSSPILESDISAPGYLMNTIIASANPKYEAPACAKPLRRRQAKFETTPNVQNTNVPNKHFLK